jgi:hypothetical protein
MSKFTNQEHIIRSLILYTCHHIIIHYDNGKIQGNQILVKNNYFLLIYEKINKITS